MIYDYDYFTGANIIVLVDNEPLLEVAGISFNEMDSQQPIYGYSSRLFDTVLPGQKIIQGKLVINLMDTFYLYKAISYARGEISDSTGLKNVDNLSYSESDTREQLTSKFWGNPTETTEEKFKFNDVTVVGPVDLMIEYGQKFRKRLLSCFFIGKSSVIQIDEHVVLEEYTFIARDSLDERM